MTNSLGYNVLDVETNIKNQGEDAVGNFKASPFHHDNHIVLLGENHSALNEVRISSVMPPPGGILGHGSEQTIYVGHNIGFDFLYLYKDIPEMREKLERGLIWDTMIVEYLLTGQGAMFVPLDTLSLKYGGTLKDDKIKEYWKANVDTADIPAHELAEYLKHDCLNTEIVFLAQMEAAYESGQLDLIRTQMDARLATIMMEWNGMHLDSVGLASAAEVLKDEIDELESDIAICMRHHFDLPVGHKLEISPASAVQLACFLWGGALSFNIPAPVIENGQAIKYKTGARKGEVKTKIARLTKNITPFLHTQPAKYGATRGSKGLWSTNEDVLKKAYDDQTLSTPKRDILEMLLEIRKKGKDYSAFYKGMGDLMWGDNCIHPTYNHAATGTGRLSCSKPNLQQVSGDK